jgi:hypothetical protein
MAKKKAAEGGLVLADAPEGALNAAWVDPVSLTANPGNWKVHPEEQGEVLDELIGEFGYVKPFLFNTRTGLLVDGHGRLELAIKNGTKAVPVWTGDWTEEQEAKLIVALDESARLAKGDPAKLHDLLQKFKPRTEALAEMVTRMGEREGITAMIARLQPDLTRALAALPQTDTGPPSDTASYSDVPPGIGGIPPGGQVIEDHGSEWVGMPEFQNEDKTAYQSVHVHFKDQAAVDAFAALIGQKILPRTRAVWYPVAEIDSYADKRYEAIGPGL